MRGPSFWFAVMFGAVLPLGARDVGVTILDGELGIPLEGAEIRSYDGTDYRGDGEGRVVLSVPDDRAVVVRGAYPGYGSERLTIDTEHDEFVLELYLTGTLEAGELVLEESRAGELEAPAERAAAPAAEEEVQAAGEPELAGEPEAPAGPLPGVGYAGGFNALPGIRGGRPGDLMAVMDGFYIENPYYWGGAVSIFDPRMVESARLSRGVFSARNGHTVSGLLDIAVKRPSPGDVGFELDISTSAAAGSLSFPLNRRGGVMITGRISYYDPVIWAARGISGASGLEALKPAESVSAAPYIRGAALSAAYGFTDSLELGLTGFFGADGGAVDYENSDGGSAGTSGGAEIEGRRSGCQGFGLLTLAWSPRGGMVLKAGLGAGYLGSGLEGRIAYPVKDLPFRDEEEIAFSEGRTGVQGRVDFDWDLGRGFLAALGLRESYAFVETETGLPARAELPGDVYNAIHGTNYHTDYVSYPAGRRAESAKTGGLTSSAYLLTEYRDPGGRFGAELGLRLDHYFFKGEGFSAAGGLSPSPRLNADFNLLRDRGPFSSLSLSLGAGLFSAAGDILYTLRARDSPGDSGVEPDRSFTGAGGVKAEFPGGLSVDLEAYYQYVFNRTYVFSGAGYSAREFRFDGQGRIWGFDLMLKKNGGPYLDGWISYSFNHARRREPGLPAGPFTNVSGAVSGDWYYPSFHRFHELNLILNIKPVEQFAITTRLGFAGGVPLAAADPYSVSVLDEAGGLVNTVQKWKRSARQDGRTSFSIPLDLKFSFFTFSPHGKSRREFYVALENALSLFHSPGGNTTFNPYTGGENTGSLHAPYDIPFPVLSFGFKWSY
jgi:hypothetical protein